MTSSIRSCHGKGVNIKSHGPACRYYVLHSFGDDNHGYVKVSIARPKLKSLQIGRFRMA